MPFEPRLIRPDDVCDDELELALPADLAALAEQLTVDANHLAARSLGSRPASPPVAAQPIDTGSRWRRAASAAAILLIASAGVARWATWPEARQATTLVSVPHHIASDPQPAVDTMMPAQFFQGLSGPEREGLLDLMEEDSSQQASLSI